MELEQILTDRLIERGQEVTPENLAIEEGIYIQELADQAEADRVQEIADKVTFIDAYVALVFTHVEIPVLDFTDMTSTDIANAIASLGYQEASIIEHLRVEALTARFDALPDLRMCMTKSNQHEPNSKKFRFYIIRDNDVEKLELLEAAADEVKAVFAKNERLELARNKRKLIDKGIDILSMVHVINEEIVIDEVTFAQTMASAELALIERYLMNGSLGSAKTLLTNLDLTSLPHTEENRSELISLF